MKIFKSIFDFYINSSIHVALAVYALVWVTFLKFGLAYDEAVAYFVFYGTITGYNFVKYAPIAKLHYRSLTRSLRGIQVFSFCCFLLTGYYFFRLSQPTFWFVCVFFVLTLFYVFPFFFGKTLRTLAGFKIFTIAGCWAGVTVLLPVVNAGLDLNWDIWVTFVQRILFVIVITIPFEIRDLNYDHIELRTLPQQLGVWKSKMLGIGLLIVFSFLDVFESTVTLMEIGSTLIITGVILIFLLKTKKEQSAYYCSFWTEGVPILWLFIVLVFHRLF